jgi:hypothetical protein
MRPELFDPILEKHRFNIEEFSFLSSGLCDDPFYGFKDTEASDKARTNNYEVNIMGV